MVEQYIKMVNEHQQEIPEGFGHKVAHYNWLAGSTGYQESDQV
jgi:hypothetical protein